MKTIAEQLVLLNQVKQDIKNALVNKGVDMTDIAFPNYANKILTLKSPEVRGGRLYRFTSNSTVPNTVSSVKYYTCAGKDPTNISNYSTVTADDTYKALNGSTADYWDTTGNGMMIELHLKEPIQILSLEVWTLSNVASDYKHTLKMYGLTGSTWKDIGSRDYSGNGNEKWLYRNLINSTDTETKFSAMRFVFYHNISTYDGRYMRIADMAPYQWIGMNTQEKYSTGTEISDAAFLPITSTWSASNQTSTSATSDFSFWNPTFVVNGTQYNGDASDRSCYVTIEAYSVSANKWIVLSKQYFGDIPAYGSKQFSMTFTDESTTKYNAWRVTKHNGSNSATITNAKITSYRYTPPVSWTLQTGTLVDKSKNGTYGGNNSSAYYSETVSFGKEVRIAEMSMYTKVIRSDISGRQDGKINAYGIKSDGSQVLVGTITNQWATSTVASTDTETSFTGVKFEFYLTDTISRNHECYFTFKITKWYEKQ